MFFVVWGTRESEREREREWEGIEGSGGCNCRLQVAGCPEPGGGVFVGTPFRSQRVAAGLLQGCRLYWTSKPKPHTRSDPSGSADRFGVPFNPSAV